jgi:predicted  nucleic acid-binding Zn-ribbon protein
VVILGVRVADWVGMNTASSDEWLSTAAAEALEAIADIHAAGQEELTQVSEQAARHRNAGPGASSDTDLNALQQTVAHARHARAAASDPNQQAAS